ncbi:MAG: macrolide ABC transporter ATP-binding protein, partial [Acidobacteriia bacterium]|nr:macrolide ABC transporter ATP-binding protein [Terriglobia bacterium]
VLVTHEHDIAAHAHRILHIRDGKIDRDERVS